MPLQIRRGPQEERDDLVTSYVPLASGEPLFTTDDGNFYIGDGLTPGGVHVNAPPDVSTILPTYVGQIGEIEKDTILQPGIKSPFITLNGFSVTIDLDRQISSNVTPNFNELYDLGDVDFRYRKIFVSGNGISVGEVDIVAVNRPGIGTVISLPPGSLIGAQPIQPEFDPSIPQAISITAQDSIPLVDAIEGQIYLDGTVKGNIVPDLNNVRDIGESSTRFKDLYLDGSINLGFAEITENAGSLTFGSPTYQLEPMFIVDSTKQGLILLGDTEPASINFPKFNIEAHRGSVDSPLAVDDNDYLGAISVDGYNGNNYVISSTIVFKVDDTTITTSTTNINAEVFVGNPAEIFNETGKYLKVSSDGRVAGASITVGSYETGSEPTNAVQGMIIFDDITKRFKGFNGTNWVDFHV